MNADNSKSLLRFTPYLLLLFGLACLGYGTYVLLTKPSSKVVSRVSYDPFPDFFENSFQQITIKFENLTNQPIRVVGVEGC